MFLDSVRKIADLVGKGSIANSVEYKWFIKCLTLNPECCVIVLADEEKSIKTDYNKAIQNMSMIAKLYRATLKLNYVSPKFISYENLSKDKLKKIVNDTNTVYLVSSNVLTKLLNG